MPDFLRKTPLFADLSDEDLQRLNGIVEEIHLAKGAWLFHEGEPGDHAYIVKEGQIEIVKHSSGREIMLAVRDAGSFIGEMALLVEMPRTAGVRGRTDVVLLALPKGPFNNLLDTSPSAARSVLKTVLERWRNTNMVMQQSEKMAQLGTLTAGVAHELNNPAAAVQRGAQQLQQMLTALEDSQTGLRSQSFSADQIQQLESLAAQIRTSSAEVVMLDPLAKSDLEYEMETWLDDHGVPNAWDLAPTLVDMGYDEAKVTALSAGFSPEQLGVVISWLGAVYKVYNLVGEIHHGASRISEIVKALKSYSYLDQAPVQEVDLQDGLDSTLVILRSKLKSGVIVHRDYSPSLPHILAYGSELNQVWTNLIDNAVDAMNGQGEIIIRTIPMGDWVRVEIEDTGPGIPEKNISKLFDPFFTTKPPGKGTGLGLHISYNIVVNKHHGDIQVYSNPGKTVFRIFLPINFEKTTSGPPVLDSYQIADDDYLLQILDSAHNIAVVGMTAKKNRPGHTVPAYLQQKGYRVIPVNPQYEEILGERAYPSLLEIPDPVDTVLIFRRSDDVPPIVEQAIQIGAKHVWMQLDIFHPQAAEKARSAGLMVAMDVCMRATYQRLKT